MEKMRAFVTQFFVPAESIAGRLRMAFAAIVLVFAIAALLIGIQINRIMRAHDELTTSALPMLRVSQDAVGNLNRLSMMLEALTEPNNELDPETIRGGIAAEVWHLRQNLKTLPPDQFSDDIVVALNTSLATAENAAFVVLNLKIAIALKHETLMDHAQTIDAMLGGRSGAPDVGLQTPALTSQRATLSALAALIANARSEADAADLKQLAQTVDLMLMQLKTGIAALPPTIEKTAAQQLLSDVQTAFFGADGLIQRRAQYDALLQSHHRAQDRYDPFLKMTADVASDLVDRSLTITTRATGDMKRAVLLSTLVTLTALAFALGAILLSNRKIVEAQFNQRMLSLTRSVEAIATGDLDHEIKISGRDEIANVAKALNIFKDNARDLRRTNTELEKFAHVAAHDLRSPVRAIEDLSKWTLEDQENRLSGESKAYLSLLQGRTKRLSTLITDLLDYVQIGQEAETVAPLNIGNLADACLQVHDPDRHFELQLAENMPNLVGPQMIVQQILSNLISNAVKHHDRLTGHITVEVRPIAENLCLTVRDDGPGIDPKYHDKVFELFQTLRPRDEVEGTGLGLAIVKKLTENAHGSVRILSEAPARRGTCIEVMLPLATAYSQELQTCNIAA